MNRSAWTVWVVSTVTTFAFLESKGVRSKKDLISSFSEAFEKGGFPETPLSDPLFTRGLLDGAFSTVPYVEPPVEYPTLTACLRYWLGIYPHRARSRVCRPVFGALVAWFFAHILYGVPWPFEREVIQRVRSSKVRRSKW